MRRPKDDPTSERIAALLREVPWASPDSERVREMRTQLASSPLPARVRRRSRLLPWLAAAGLAGAALTAVLATRSRPAPFERAMVQADPSARWTHQPGEGPEPERVRLHRGTLQLTVAPLAPGERFLLETDDAEIEVRGTRFEVIASEGRLIGVTVVEGLVELRQRSAPPRALGAGQAWHLPRAPRATVERVKPPPAPKRRPQAVLRPEDPSEAAFREGWTAIGRSDLGLAAELFAQAEANPALAEDAGYGRAIALSRAGRTQDAMSAMRRFLERFPNAARADELSIALGWLLVDADELDEAEQRFATARSTIEPLKRSAERGLEEVARKRAAPLPR